MERRNKKRGKGKDLINRDERKKTKEIRQKKGQQKGFEKTETETEDERKKKRKRTKRGNN